MPPQTLRTQVLIVGAGAGGTAAALALARLGVACILTEPTDWVGGQLTSQGVPPDENKWIESPDFQAATSDYLTYRANVRQYYRDHRPLLPTARANPRLNPGNGWVSQLCHEPRIGHAVLEAMLAPGVEAGLIQLILDTIPVQAQVIGDAVKAVTLQNQHTGHQTTIEADYFLDATEIGDLLKLSGTEYYAGAEHTSVHDELHGRPDKTDVHDVQAVSWCFALEHRPGENHTIAKPDNYDFWRNYTPPLTPPWPNSFFNWTQIGGAEHKPRYFKFLPYPQKPADNEWEMWRYRRIVDTELYDPAHRAAHPDVALINMVQMDYFQKPTVEVSDEERAAAFEGAKNQSRCFIYWMQTEAPNFDGSYGGVGFPGLKLRGDELGTSSAGLDAGFAKAPYIRESRRLDALTIVTERHVGLAQRKAEGLIPQTAKEFEEAPHAHLFEDSVGIGHYRLDLHPSAAFRNSIYVEAAPFRIPLGALIPKRVKNVLAAGKCLGVTHITNGCFRLHPTEWNVGQSAAHVAAFAIESAVPPEKIQADRSLLRQLQARLTRDGIPLAWPWEKGAALA